MSVPAGMGVQRSGRMWSLRREWSRAFTVMLGLLLVAAVASVVGVWGLVDQVNSTARQLRHESATSAALQTAVVAHEEIAHKLLSNEPVDRTGFVRQQQSISSQFAEAVGYSRSVTV